MENLLREVFFVYVSLRYSVPHGFAGLLVWILLLSDRALEGYRTVARWCP